MVGAKKDAETEARQDLDDRSDVNNAQEDSGVGGGEANPSAAQGASGRRGVAEEESRDDDSEAEEEQHAGPAVGVGNSKAAVTAKLVPTPDAAVVSENVSAPTDSAKSPDAVAPTLISSSAAATVPAPPAKCKKCTKRVAREGCTQDACLNCCTDDNCEKHRKGKDHAVWKEQVMAGTTDVQLMAKEKRSKIIRKGRFHETGFVYQGDTIVIWNIFEYLSNPKWKEEAARKSLRRRGRREDDMTPPEAKRRRTGDFSSRGSRKRKSLEDILEDLRLKRAKVNDE